MNSSIEFSQSSYLIQGDSTWIDFLYAGDELRLSKKNWGLYERVTLKVSYGLDSLKKAFILGQQPSDTIVLYIADEDRNISVSGETKIVGTAYLPQAGIKPAFVDGNYYKGIERIIDGSIKYSERMLPSINKRLLETIFDNTKDEQANTNKNIPKILRSSFFSETYHIKNEQPIVLSDVDLNGNIIIQSDSSIKISRDANLNNIICIAPQVHVEAGFKGAIQIFAKDSIYIANDCEFQYPSSLVVYSKNEESSSKLSLGKNVNFSGTILFYEDQRSNVPNMVEFYDNVKIKGDVLIFGLLKYHKNLNIEGATYCYRFINQTNMTMYENYLIDITLDRNSLNPFFVRSSILNKKDNLLKHQIVKWLD